MYETRGIVLQVRGDCKQSKPDTATFLWKRLTRDQFSARRPGTFGVAASIGPAILMLVARSDVPIATRCFCRRTADRVKIGANGSRPKPMRLKSRRDKRPKP